MKRTLILSVFIPFLSFAACKNGSCRRPIRQQIKKTVVQTAAELATNQTPTQKPHVRQCTSGQCSRR